jgi:poly(3-hydroxybutyrate) depolymerase
MKAKQLTILLMWLTTACGASAATTDEQTLINEWKDSVRTVFADAYRNKVLVNDSLTMKLHWSIYGPKPADGYALCISLHGGGGAPAELNDQQWENQKRLYRPQGAVYLSPRAITNTWDLHFRPEDDTFYRQIIMMMQAYCDVNPNKVYIMGYSAGGDGVWRLGPRMADHWAAASMMAGHPGDVSLLNLRNTPFMIWCGQLDDAYDRVYRCQDRIAEMDSLHAADPEGYIHEGHIVEGKGHWMDRVDTVAVSWMAKYQRNPYPKRVVWHQADVVTPYFYWLSTPANELARDKEVRADINGNTITITRCDYSQLTLSLCQEMVDLKKPVTVMYQGRKLFKGKVKTQPGTLRRTLYQRNDPAYMFPAEITVKIK